MSTNTFNSRTALRGAPTESAAVADLAVGDLIFWGNAGPEPWRIRALDVFPNGGRVNVLVTPGANLVRVQPTSLGVFHPTDVFKRVVMS